MAEKLFLKVLRLDVALNISSSLKDFCFRIASAVYAFVASRRYGNPSKLREVSFDP